MQEKSVKLSGACEKTASKSEYFSWINSTNEGSTQEQTLANLNFFKYLKDTYGMVLDIYAWDAGNLDGAGNSYESETSEKIKKQYPEGYKKVVEFAKKIGTRMGVWGGPDGYGETVEQANARRDFLVHLCRDYNWALFKFDAVCGDLREQMHGEFEKTMIECRKYSPDLILLNHRINLGENQKYSTTFLWEGLESYTDVHLYNTFTAPHNRAYIFSRGHTPELKRLTEDHGVCISSSVDYFEDDLVYQAFNRCLILAPEIYGNPWLIRDDELPLLARVFNLHRRHREILVDGMIPEGDFGENAIIRGNGQKRFLCTGSASWQSKFINFNLDQKIGLEKCDKVCVIRRFPTEKFIGEFKFGDRVELELLPFRACLFEICDLSVCDNVVTNCEYEVIHETNGVIDKINILKCDGEVELYSPKNAQVLKTLYRGSFDISLQNPQKIASATECVIPQNHEYLYEKIHFTLDNDSLEKRSLNRSGKSKIMPVNGAREAFFNQYSYRLRATDGEFLFDENSVYDQKSRSYINHDNRKGFRIEGGCLRVDLGRIYKVDKIQIEYFSADGKVPWNFDEQNILDLCESSINLKAWKRAPLKGVKNAGEKTIEYLAYYSDQTQFLTGSKMRAEFEVNGNMRYFRLPEQPDRLLSVKIISNGKHIALKNPRVNNLFAPYNKKTIKNAVSAVVSFDKFPLHPYIAVAIEGQTGSENVCCIAEVNGKNYVFTDRAPSYPVNSYEYPVHPVNGYYTFYLPLKKSWLNKQIKVTALFSENSVPVDLYLCDGKKKRVGKMLKIN